MSGWLQKLFRTLMEILMPLRHFTKIGKKIKYHCDILFKNLLLKTKPNLSKNCLGGGSQTIILEERAENLLMNIFVQQQNYRWQQICWLHLRLPILSSVSLENIQISTFSTVALNLPTYLYSYTCIQTYVIWRQLLESPIYHRH